MRSEKARYLADLPALATLSDPQQVEDGSAPAKRKRRFLWAWWISLPIAVSMALAGIALVGLQVSALAARSSFQKANESGFASATSRYLREEGLAWQPARWVSQYNLGTTYLANGDAERAVSWLELAMLNVPKAEELNGAIQAYSYECQVRVNLALALESVADKEEATEGGGDASAALYQRSLVMIKPCATSSNPDDSDANDSDPDDSDQGDSGEGEPDQNERDLDRIEKKANGQPDSPGQPDSTPDPNSKPDPGDSPNESEKPQDSHSGETPAQRDKREQLEQRNRDQHERLREKEESKHGSSSGYKW